MQLSINVNDDCVYLAIDNRAIVAVYYPDADDIVITPPQSAFMSERLKKMAVNSLILKEYEELEE